jgi:1,4-dihydroxy-2-naphthoate octaprenyltransferase
MMNLVRVIRAPFFTATVIPGLVGAALAWYDGSLHVGYLLLTVIGIVCINAGLNTSNDYFDHLSGNDAANHELTPFSGGSRTIQEGMVTPRQMLLISLAFYGVAMAIGILLVAMRGLPLLWISLAGMFLAVFSSAPPIRLNYVGHGLGELASMIGCGPALVLGSYYVQTQRLTWESFWVSVIVGCFVAAVLYVNEFPDYAADKAAGKNTLVVVLGKDKAVWGYVALLVGAYGVLVVGAALGLFPVTILAALISFPLAYRGIRGLFRHYNDTRKLIPTNAMTIQLNLAVGLLLCVGYVIAGIVS